MKLLDLYEDQQGTGAGQRQVGDDDGGADKADEGR